MTPDRRAAASRLTEAEQNRLIIENMKLVSAVAANYRGGSIGFEELVAIGREGLVKAARSFDPDAGAKFSTWAWIKIESEIATAVRAGQADWFPKETDGPPPSDESYSNERVYQWDSWGRHGNPNAIGETWQQLPATPEDLRQLYDDLADKSGAGLSRSQRKLVRLVFLDGVSMDQAARAKRGCRTIGCVEC